VKQDLKRKLAREIELDEGWYDTDYLAAQLTLMLSALPADMAAALRQELSPGFVPNLLHTLGFVRQYQQLQKEDASPEKLDNMEMRAGIRHPCSAGPSTTTSDDGLSPSPCSNARLAGRCHLCSSQMAAPTLSGNGPHGALHPGLPKIDHHGIVVATARHRPALLPVATARLPLGSCNTTGTKRSGASHPLVVTQDATPTMASRINC
jgi:hypothetical protein